MKNETQSFSLLLWNNLLILKILPVTRFREPKAAILTLKMLTGSRLWFCKIIPQKLPDTSWFLRIFPAANEESALENIDQWQRREFWGGYEWSFSKFVNNFKEANKYNNCIGFWKAFEITWKPSANTHKILIKKFIPTSNTIRIALKHLDWVDFQIAKKPDTLRNFPR